MQQKYCDQGRSWEVLTITWPTFCARRCCGCGEAEEDICLAVDEQAHRRLFRTALEPGGILAGVHADICHHAGDEDVFATPQFGDRYSLPLEIADRPDSLVSEQFVAAAVNAGEHDNGALRIDRRHQRWRGVQIEICLAFDQQPIRIGFGAACTGTQTHILDLGETLEVQ